MTEHNIVIGSRGSRLAVIQSEMVRDFIREKKPGCQVEILTMKTTGDKILDRTLEKIGGKGLFVKELDKALMDGRSILSVHSLKDMPMEVPAELPLLAFSRREDPRDVLILREAVSVDDLPKGAVIGTGSKRRKYQLLKIRPDLNIVGIRGNVDTRIRKMQEEEMDGIVLAAAGINRLGREQEITCYLEPDQMIPAPAQGTLALEVKADNIQLIRKLNRLSDQETDICVKAERQFLKQIGGSCHLPVGAYCKIQDEKLILRAMFGTEDGKKLVYTKVESAVLNKIEDSSQIDEICRQIAREAVEKIQIQLSHEE